MTEVFGDVWVAGAGLTPFALLAAVMVALIKMWPQRHKLVNDEHDALRGDLMARIVSLETALETLTVRHATELKELRAEMNAMRKGYERKLARISKRLSDETHSLDTLIALLRAAPERVDESLEQIEKLRLQQKQEIAMERGRHGDDD